MPIERQHLAERCGGRMFNGGKEHDGKFRKMEVNVDKNASKKIGPARLLCAGPKLMQRFLESKHAFDFDEAGRTARTEERAQDAGGGRNRADH
jgi:hypothetical protein